MIRDMRRGGVESDSRAPDFFCMQASAESMDDFNNPFFGLLQDVIQKILDGIKGDDVSSRHGPPCIPARLLAVILLYLQKASLSQLIAHICRWFPGLITRPECVCCQTRTNMYVYIYIYIHTYITGR